MRERIQIYRRLGGVDKFISINPDIWSEKLVLAFQGKYPEEEYIDSNHFVLAAEDLQEGRLDDFAKRLEYIAFEYYDNEPPEVTECFRELAASGGLDYDEIKREALRPRSQDEILTRLTNLAENLPEDSSIREWVQDLNNRRLLGLDLYE